jgi:hypothetical protein
MLFISIVLLSDSAFTKEWNTLSQIGNWKLMSQNDDLTDELSCVIIYNNDFRIQVDIDGSNGVLYWSLRGQGGVNTERRS